MTGAERNRFRQLQLFRLIIGSGMVILFSRIVDLGTDVSLLVVAVGTGVVLAGASLKRFSATKVMFVHLASLTVLWICTTLAHYVVTGSHFSVYRFTDHITLIGFFYLFAFFSTWLFWRKRSAVTLEAFFWIGIIVAILSGHRNYQLDAPKELSELAWRLNLPAQQLLLGIGVVCTIVVGLYFILAGDRPLFGKQNPVKSYGPIYRTASVLVPSFLVFLLFLYANYVNSSYSVQLGKTSEGVGQEDKEGKSPLGFHSAVGKTKQPAALVRLEGDYKQNPWVPMLYFREGALSQFNGKELVIANRAYDTDVPRTKIGEPYIALEQNEDDLRESVAQSVYLLTDHLDSFAIDYPKSIRLIANPEENRFKVAYQAISAAPTLKLEEISGEEVGEVEWDKATWEHYLRAPGTLAPDEERKSVSDDLRSELLDKQGEDLRYGALARRLAGDLEAPVLKARAVVEYLSNESIYTRKPGHSPTTHGDAVAPYLFAEEKRGYCVHFSHAAVYLFRLMGIPSRIATGYLTDLTYAKDGHILLHVGDRHAWPEIYVRDVGWVVVDITPARAENEQVIVPDEKLLEELMSKIDPVQELTVPLPEDLTDTTADGILAEVVNKRNVIILLTGVFVFFLLLKLWLRHAWRLGFAPERQVRLAYVAFSSSVADLGITRRFGETRHEFARRLHHSHQVKGMPITELNERNVYGHHTRHPMREEIARALTGVYDSWQTKGSWLKRLVAFFSPMSLTRLGRW